MKLATKISIAFFIIAMILVSSIAPVFYITARDSLEHAIFSHLSTTAQSRARHIETYLKGHTDRLEQLSQSVVLEELLLANKEGEDYGQKLNTSIHRIKRVVEVPEHLYRFLVLDKNGIIVVSSEETDIGEDKSADSYFSEAKLKPFIKDVYYSEKAEKKLMDFSAPIRDNRTGEFLGVVVAEHTLAELNKITTDRTGLGKTGEMYLINIKGLLLE